MMLSSLTRSPMTRTRIQMTKRQITGGKRCEGLWLLFDQRLVHQHNIMLYIIILNPMN